MLPLGLLRARLLIPRHRRALSPCPQSPGDSQHAQHLAQSRFTGSPNESASLTSPQGLKAIAPPWVATLHVFLGNVGQPRPSLHQFSSVAQSRPILRDPMNCSTTGLLVHHQLPEFTQTHVQRVSDAIQPSHPFSSCSQSLPASVFSNESDLRMRWPKYWSFSLSISPSEEHPGLICFRMDWLRTPISVAIEIYTVNILSLLFYIKIYNIYIICIM